MPKLTIDGKEIEIEDGLTVMQACERAGAEIPHFCFHERLKIAGNCRMCLVDIEKSPKPVASCAMPASEGMIVHTNSSRVKKAREGVMEFLLINHPLDCPICDQGGECDLQDQAFKYGRPSSRYSENKRSVKDKNLGPLVKTEMTRCIHCTRCIRFSTDVAGVPEMGAIGRGEHMEITSYLEKTLTSELSGNIIDLCPVGALTSKPYAFKARSWELESTESIDVMEAMGTNIRIDARGLEVMRILPKLNEDINEEWLSDKARFSYDGLKNQRLDRPYVKKNGKLQESSWDEVMVIFAEKMRSVTSRPETLAEGSHQAGSESLLPDIPKQVRDGGSVVWDNKIAAIAGTTASCETMFLLKKLLASLGSNLCDANQFGYKFDLSARGNYLFNTTIAGIEAADFCLLVGANPRQVAPVLNARIGKMVREGGLTVARIGEMDDQTYKIIELGDDLNALDSAELSKLLVTAKNPMIIVGDAVLVRPDAHGILSALHKIMPAGESWNGFNILHNHASMVGALDLGFIYGENGAGTAEILEKTRTGEVKVLYLLGADDIDTSRIGADCFVIYQGHHGDAGANRADVILPEAAYTEQDGMYVNMEGRAQKARAAVAPPGQAKTGIEIIEMVAENMLSSSDTLSSSRRRGSSEEALQSLLIIPDPGLRRDEAIRQEMAKTHPVFAHVDEIIPSEFKVFKSKAKLTKKPLVKLPINYYMTDPISRASVTMARCTKALQMIVKNDVKGGE